MTTPDAPNRRGDLSRKLDPTGKRALFSTPVAAPGEVVAAGPTAEGKEALYSVGARKPGTAVIECSRCESRSRATLLDVTMRSLTGVWLPARGHNRLIKCPTCHERSWCRVHWQA